MLRLGVVSSTGGKRSYGTQLGNGASDTFFKKRTKPLKVPEEMEDSSEIRISH